MGHRPEVGARGFTLLELVVVLLVVSVAIGLVAPALGRSVEAVRVRAEVAGFSATLRHAREQAITSRQTHTVVVNLTNRMVTVTAEDENVRWTRAISTRLRVDVADPEALTVRFEPQGTSSGGAFRLTSGAIVYRVTVDAVTGRVRNRRE
jgi:general secretion pathway protein H